MNKSVYLKELETLLKSGGVADYDEILSEYAEHFDRKISDGYSEDEISARLGKPSEIALQFQGESIVSRKAMSLWRGCKITGLVFADLFAGSLFLILYSWVVTLGACALVFGLTGFAIPFGSSSLPSWFVSVPYMPYFGGILIAISLLGLTVLTLAGTFYSFRFTHRSTLSYLRWHKNVLKGTKYPPVAVFPLAGDAMRRAIRTAVIVALFVFGIFFAIGFITLAVNAGRIEFWHAWNWFV